jgi:hypothetical protein
VIIGQGLLWEDDAPAPALPVPGGLPTAQGAAGGLLADHDAPEDAGRPRPGCPRCAARACVLRRHPDAGDCWHDHDRHLEHDLGDHRGCLPGDAAPLPEDDAHGEHGDYGDDADRCRWAARWRAAALALACRATAARPLLVVLLDAGTGARPLGAFARYQQAGPARTRAGRRPGDYGLGAAKQRACVVCAVGHLH